MSSLSRTRGCRPTLHVGKARWNSLLGGELDSARLHGAALAGHRERLGLGPC
jgi:hypothetical protein